MIDKLIEDIAGFAQIGAFKLKERIWETGFYSLVVQDSHHKGEQPLIECRVQGHFSDLPGYVQEHLEDIGNVHTDEFFGYTYLTSVAESAGVTVEITGVKRT